MARIQRVAVARTHAAFSQAPGVLPWPASESFTLTPQSLKYRLSQLLPKVALEQLRKRYRRYVAAKRRSNRATELALHGSFGTDELLRVLRDLGITQGSVVFVQTSFNDLHTFAGRPIDLLNALRLLVGLEGTLLMPAYTTGTPNADGAPLVIETLPTYTGIVNELFRRSPGVTRSLHPRHSICGEGPLAASLLAGHERCLFADGPGSPFDRLRSRLHFVPALDRGLRTRVPSQTGA
jgi:aminoglycoside 3-N-acetyltransferase